MANKVSMGTVIPEHQTILRAGSKLIGLVRDVSSFAIKGSNSINYPTLAKRTAQTKALNGTYDINNANFGDDILLLNEKLGDAFEVEQHQEEQNVLKSLEANSKNTLEAMGEAMDVKIYTALKAACATRNVVPTADFYNDVVDLAKKLDDAHVPQTGRVLAVTSADYAKLLKTKDFVRFDSKGDGSAISTGAVGEILGFQVVKLILDGVVGQETIAYHQNGVISATQGDMIMMSANIPESTKVRYVISEAFGCKIAQRAGVAQDGDSPFCVRLGADAP